MVERGWIQARGDGKGRTWHLSAAVYRVLDTPAGYVRTDAKGEALIPIAQTGLMTIRLTHMTRPKMPEYEWESFWTTLTFRLP